MNKNFTKPVIILHPQFNSHHFEERTIELDDHVKVGRAVSRCKPSPNNAIFDCRVLSRNHAIILFQSDEFWLQDTNSSNGTFVNNVRVTKLNDGDSCKRKIFSGDIIKFGVEVIEKDVSYACIVASVTIHLPNGCEARTVPHVQSAQKCDYESMNSEKLFKLSFFLDDIIFREESLNKRLDSLSTVLENTDLASQLGWQAMVNEEKLLNKLYLYEQQIKILKEDSSDEQLKLKLCDLITANEVHEQSRKSEVETLLGENLLLLQKISELEGILRPLQEECVHLKERCQSLKSSHIELSEGYEKNLAECTNQLVDANKDKEVVRKQLNENAKICDSMQLKIEELTNENRRLKDYFEIVQLQSSQTSHKDENIKENLNTKTVALGIDRHANMNPTPDEFLSECVEDFELSLKFSRLLKDKLSPLTSSNSAQISFSRSNYSQTLTLNSLEIMVRKIVRHHKSAMTSLHAYLLRVNSPSACLLLEPANQIVSRSQYNGNKTIVSLYAALTNLQEEEKQHQSELRIMRTERNRLEALLDQAYEKIHFLQNSFPSGSSNAKNHPDERWSTIVKKEKRPESQYISSTSLAPLLILSFILLIFSLMLHLSAKCVKTLEVPQSPH